MSRPDDPPGDSSPVAAPSPPEDTPTPITTVTTRSGVAKQRVAQTRQRLEDTRQHRGSVDTIFLLQEHDQVAGGSLLAGAIAFRLFLWNLPATLVAVAGLGFLVSAGDTAPADAVRSVGLRGLSAHSIQQAADESHRSEWLLLATGLVLLFLASSKLMKTIWAAYALAWRQPVTRLPSKNRAVAILVGAIMVCLAAAWATGAIRRHSALGGLLGTIAVMLVYAAAWWVVSTQLPHADAPNVALVPGALLVGLGFEAMQLVTVYYLAGKVDSSSKLYGSFGVAAALLLGLYFVGRLIVAAALLDATMWERQKRQGAA